MQIETKNYKDTVFRALYSDKNNLLELYNAINGSHYSNPDDLIIKTLKGQTFLGVKNDISFILDYELNLYEHNSTPCPNIPLRDLYYIASSYKKIVTHNDTYKSELIKIPAPRFFVFYNGTAPMPDKVIYRLSDMFLKPTDSPELELIVTVLNVNEGRNPKLMKTCKTLNEYSLFVSKVRKYTQEAKHMHSKSVFNRSRKAIIKNIVTKAIDECIEEDILRQFFESHREEAIDMGTKEYSIEKDWQLIKKWSSESATESTASLFAWLFDNNRSDDAVKASHDIKYLKKLLKEYNSAKK